MEGKQYRYNVNDLELSSESITAVIGYSKEDVPENIVELIEQTLDYASGLDSVKGEYRIVENIDLIKESGIVVIGGSSFLTRKIIISQLRGSSSAALFLATAGPDIGEKSRRQMSDGDLLEGYISDVVGSEIVEAVADKMQEDLRLQAFASGFGITNRFSPGYCGWDVAEQHKLFSLMPDNYCGIELTESALMNPVKSVSGLIGIGKEARFQPYTCNRCDSANCIYRGKK